MSISRRIAGGLLALTTLGIVALAEPASAQAPVDGHEASQDPVQTQTTETPEQKRARDEAAQELREAIGRAKNPEIVPDDPDPLPDDFDPDDPCDLDPYGCGGGGGYDPFAAELLY